jgi:hypothetical protein
LQSELALENHVPPTKHKNVSTGDENIAKCKMSLHSPQTVDIATKLKKKRCVSKGKSAQCKVTLHWARSLLLTRPFVSLLSLKYQQEYVSASSPCTLQNFLLLISIFFTFAVEQGRVSASSPCTFRTLNDSNIGVLAGCGM